MESLLNLPLWINKSGLVTKDATFDTFTPHAGVEVVFLISDTATWIRYQGSDGKVYPLYLPDGIEKPIAVRSGELSSVQILSVGNDWQGNSIPTPDVPGAVIRWYGH